MNIGFEAKRVFMNFTGLGNYGRFIIDSLSDHFPEHEYFLYTPGINDSGELRPILDKKNIHVITPAGLFSKPVFSSIWRSWAVSRNKTIPALNIFHGLSQELPMGLPKHVKKIVTVHDLIFLRYPGFYNPIDVRIYSTKVKKACESADCIVAISHQTAEDVMAYLKVPESKVRIVYQGCHPVFRNKVSDKEKEQVRLKYNLPEKFLLTVGTIEERKNLVTLIKALASLPPGMRIPLVALGKQTSYMEKVNQTIRLSKLEDLVYFIPHAKFPDFPAIYSASEAMIYPSVFEGFGIPLVEAIECGVPVITSTGSCFSEAAGPDALYADPYDHERIADHIAAIRTNPKLRSEMIVRSKNYIQRFQPSVIAGAMMDVYRSVL